MIAHPSAAQRRDFPLSGRTPPRRWRSAGIAVHGDDGLPARPLPQNHRPKTPPRKRMYYYSHDGLRSVRTLTDAAAVVANTYDYLPFGSSHGPSTSASVPQRYAYTGREIHPVAPIMHYRHRQHDGRVGRFTSRDKHRYWARLRASGNAYDYVGSRPVKRVDAYGLVGEDCRYTGKSKLVIDKRLVEIGPAWSWATGMPQVSYTEMTRRCMCEVECKDWDLKCFCGFDYSSRVGLYPYCRFEWVRDPPDDYTYPDEVARYQHLSSQEEAAELIGQAAGIAAEDLLTNVTGVDEDNTLLNQAGQTVLSELAGQMGEDFGDSLLAEDSPAIGGTQEEWQSRIDDFDANCPNLCAAKRGLSP
jgi:RHS repeat-associated protein